MHTDRRTRRMRSGRHAVFDRYIVLSIAGPHLRSSAFARGNKIYVNFISVDRERAGLRAEVPLHIVPLPAIAQRITAEEAFVKIGRASSREREEIMMEA